MFTDPTAAFRDFQNGGLDVISLAPEVYLEAKGQYADVIMEEPTSTLTYLGFPTGQAPFDNVQVRQAISMSIDRQLIVDQVLNGLAYPSTDIVTPPIPGSRDDACGYCVYDPDQAKQLLEESGVDPDETLQFYFNADAGHDAWVEAAARQVQENLGFDYKLQSTEWAQYLELLDARELHRSVPPRLGLDYPSPENYIRPIVGTDGDSNYTGYSNPEVDDLLVQGDEAPPRKRRSRSTSRPVTWPWRRCRSSRCGAAAPRSPTPTRWATCGTTRDSGEIAFKEISVNQ